MYFIILRRILLMKAVMYRGIGQVAVEEIAKPEMTENDYLVEVLYSGLCGTDL